MASGLLDTSVLVDWDDPAVLDHLPDDAAICAVTLAELTAGPALAADPAERARRQSRVQQAEALFDPLPFDAVTARSYGQVVAAIATAGRTHPNRIADPLIAATAHANRLALYTRNPDDFAGLEDLVEIITI
ncbi:MAG: PIN domain-containing protein [Acidimicrobiales bacterium]